MMKIQQRNKLVLLFVIVIILQLFLSNATEAAENKYQRVLHSTHDSLILHKYDFFTSDLGIILQTVVDSINKDFDCSRVEQVFMEIHEFSDSLEIVVSSKRYFKKGHLSYSKDNDTIVGFDIDKTLFLLDVKSADSNYFKEGATFLYTTMEEKSDYKYSCLQKEREGSVYNILFDFKFVLTSINRPKLISYSKFIDSGDVGYFEEANIWNKVNRFFRNLFN